ncbi:MAG: hypothetical protein ABI238_06430 [Terrimesophilobacter sp.]
MAAWAVNPLGSSPEIQKPNLTNVPLNERNLIDMSGLLVVIVVIAIVLLFIGGFVQAVQWLLWIGIILLIIAVISWLMRSLSGRRNS